MTHADEKNWKPRVLLNGGDTPQQPPPRRTNPDCDPAGIWCIPALESDTGAEDGIFRPANKGT